MQTVFIAMKLDEIIWKENVAREEIWAAKKEITSRKWEEATVSELIINLG